MVNMERCSWEGDLPCVQVPQWGFTLLYATEATSERRGVVAPRISSRELVRYGCVNHLGVVIQQHFPRLAQDNVPLRLWALFAGYDPMKCTHDDLAAIGALPLPASH